jgi:hypothetical protein
MRNDQPDPTTNRLSAALPALDTALPLAGFAVLPTLTITATSVSKNEGNSGVTTFTFTVRRTSSTLTSTVGWSIVHGGTDAADFTGATSGVLTFASGQTAQTITLSMVGDTIVEASELFSVRLSNPLNAVIGSTGIASSTIANDDKPRLSIIADASSVQEGSATADGTTPVTFTVTRDSGLGTSSAAWSVVHRGTSAADFVGATAGTVSFAAGETSQKITVLLAADATVELSEAFSVTLGSPVNATLTSATATATVTVVNDDLPTLSIATAATSVSKNEGNAGTTPFTFTVTRSSSVGTSTVNWGVFHVGTDAADFSGATSGTLTFSSGQTSKTITVNVVGDKTGELNELFGVELSTPGNATLATSTAKATIVNDDPIVILPTLTIAATRAAQAEGSAGTTPFTFTVTRSSGTGTASASWAVQHGTTSAGDFSGATSGTVSFAAGETSKVITLDVVGDVTVESDEAFSVALSNPVGATIATASAAGTIQNDDAAVLPTISITPATTSLTEGNSGTTPFTFTVTRSSGTGTSTVNWLLASGSTSSDDYAAGTPIGVSSTLSFAAGETSKTITVNVVGDTTQESDETDPALQPDRRDAGHQQHGLGHHPGRRHARLQHHRHGRQQARRQRLR